MSLLSFEIKQAAAPAEHATLFLIGVSFSHKSSIAELDRNGRGTDPLLRTPGICKSVVWVIFLRFHILKSLFNPYWWSTRWHFIMRIAEIRSRGWLLKNNLPRYWFEWACKGRTLCFRSGYDPVQRQSSYFSSWSWWSILSKSSCSIKDCPDNF